MRFSVAWPRAAMVTVEASRTVERPNASTLTSRMVWDMTVVTDKRGTTEISSESPRIEPFDGEGIAHQLQLGRLYIHSIRFAPGEMPRPAEKAGAEIATLRRELLRAIPDPQRAKYSNRIATLLPDKIVFSHAIDFLFEQVAKSSGTVIRIGEPLRVQTSMNDPRFGEVPMTTTFKLIGRVACEGPPTETGCVELETKSVATDFPLEAITSKKLGFDLPGTVEAYDNSTVSRYVFDPSGMVPYRFATQRNALTSLHTEDGKKLDGGVTVLSERKFKWRISP